jgi:malto-oligosyltrehalose trehalohydrolase
VILTGETEGYYADFAGNPVGHVARCLAEGFAFQGEIELSGKPRGHPSGHLPPTAFIDFLQNHDQIGNRALGERLSVLADGRRLEALTAVLLLSPHIPLLFMGEEWGETAPFRFFTDFHGSLADAVREGRRREFAHFKSFGAEAGHAGVPDPNEQTTFAASRLDWTGAESPEGRDRLAFYRELIGLRRDHVVPLLDERATRAGRILACGPGGIAVDWVLAGARLQLRANLTEAPMAMPPVAGRRFYPQAASEPSLDIGTLPAWGVLFALDDGEATP